MSDLAYADIRTRRMGNAPEPGVRSRGRGRCRELALRHAGVATAPAKKTLAGSAAQVGKGWRPTLTCVKQHRANHQVSMKGIRHGRYTCCPIFRTRRFAGPGIGYARVKET